MKVLHISGRRWFSTTHGNTYFSCVVSIDGEQVHEIPYEYGYGQMYEQVAREWLMNNGYIPLIDYALSIYCRENDIIFISHAVDVRRKKDL